MNYPIYKTIKGRFLITISILMLVIGAGVVFFSFTMNNRILRSNEIRSNVTNIRLLSDTMNQRLSNIVSFSQWAQRTHDIAEYLTHPDSNMSRAKDLLVERYINNDTGNRYIQRVVIGSPDRRDYIQYINNTSFSVDIPVVKTITNLPCFRDMFADNTFTFSDGFQSDPFLPKQYQSLIAIQPIYHPYRQDKIGFVYLGISPELFLDTTKNLKEKDNMDILLHIGTHYYRIDEDSYKEIGKPVPVREAVFPEQREEELSINCGFLDGKERILYQLPLVTANCELILSTSDNLVQKQMHSYSYILLGIVGCVLIVGILLYYSLTKSITRPLAMLSNRLKKISTGDFSTDPSIEWNNELGYMGRTVNALATDIEKLMQQQIADEHQKQDFRYQILQSQIKPHFIYNTLNTIKWMATVQQAPGISEIVVALSHLLKNVSKGTQTVIPIRDELALLHDYFTIQKYKYGGSITLTHALEDEAIKDNVILRFTLQPLVENAILHGIEPTGKQGSIRISMEYAAEDEILISVTDNGMGMDGDTIQKVMAERGENRSQTFRDMGILSVNKQIKYVFGEKYGLSIDSVVNRYTTVRIRLPKISHAEYEGKENEITDRRR